MTLALPQQGMPAKTAELCKESRNSKKRRRIQKPGDELLGTKICVPSSVFHMHIGPRYIEGTVKGHDKAHRGNLIVKCEGDPRRFFFPMDSVRAWAALHELLGPALPSEQVDSDAKSAVPESQVPSTRSMQWRSNAKARDCRDVRVPASASPSEMFESSGEHRVHEHGQSLHHPSLAQPSEQSQPSEASELWWSNAKVRSHKRSHSPAAASPPEVIKSSGLHEQEGDRAQKWISIAKGKEQEGVEGLGCTSPSQRCTRHAKAQKLLVQQSLQAEVPTPQPAHVQQLLSAQQLPDGFHTTAASAAVQASPLQPASQDEGDNDNDQADEDVATSKHSVAMTDSEGDGTLEDTPVKRNRVSRALEEPCSAGPSPCVSHADEPAESGVINQTCEEVQEEGTSKASGPHKGEEERRRPDKKRGRGSTSKGEVKDLIGKVVDVPSGIFGIDVPEMFYPGRVLGPDRSHASSVVVKLKDDTTRWVVTALQQRRAGLWGAGGGGWRLGRWMQCATEKGDNTLGGVFVLKLKDDTTRYYFPISDVQRWLQDMQLRLGEHWQQEHSTTGSSHGRMAVDFPDVLLKAFLTESCYVTSRAGMRTDLFAAEVLLQMHAECVGRGATCSSDDAGSKAVRSAEHGVPFSLSVGLRAMANAALVASKEGQQGGFWGHQRHQVHGSSTTEVHHSSTTGQEELHVLHPAVSSGRVVSPWQEEQRPTVAASSLQAAGHATSSMQAGAHAACSMQADGQVALTQASTAGMPELSGKQALLAADLLRVWRQHAGMEAERQLTAAGHKSEAAEGAGVAAAGEPGTSCSTDVAVHDRQSLQHLAGWHPGELPASSSGVHEGCQTDTSWQMAAAQLPEPLPEVPGQLPSSFQSAATVRHAVGSEGSPAAAAAAAAGTGTAAPASGGVFDALQSVVGLLQHGRAGLSDGCHGADSGSGAQVRDSGVRHDASSSMVPWHQPTMQVQSGGPLQCWQAPQQQLLDQKPVQQAWQQVQQGRHHQAFVEPEGEVLQQVQQAWQQSQVHHHQASVVLEGGVLQQVPQASQQSQQHSCVAPVGGVLQQVPQASQQTQQQSCVAPVGGVLQHSFLPFEGGDCRSGNKAQLWLQPLEVVEQQARQQQQQAGHAVASYVTWPAPPDTMLHLPQQQSAVHSTGVPNPVMEKGHPGPHGYITWGAPCHVVLHSPQQQNIITWVATEVQAVCWISHDTTASWQRHNASSKMVSPSGSWHCCKCRMSSCCMLCNQKLRTGFSRVAEKLDRVRRIAGAVDPLSKREVGTD